MSDNNPSGVGGENTSAGDIAPGDYVVARTSWSFDVRGPVTKVSPARVYHLWNPRGRETYFDRGTVVFYGEEQACRDLVSVLVGLRQKCDAARQELATAHRAREAKAIAAAILKASTPIRSGGK